MDSPTLRSLAIKVSQYFLDFLESDFKRQQAPRRRIVLQTEAGFRAGMKVAPYPGLRDALWQLLNKESGEDLQLPIRPRQFTRPMTLTLHNIIREQIQAIRPEAIDTVKSTVLAEAASTLGRAVDDPEQWIDQIRANAAAEIGSQIVRPLLAMLDGPLSQQAYSLVDSVFSAESELVERLASDLDSVLPEALSRYLATGDRSPLASAVDAMLTLDGSRAALLHYFASFSTADAFQEFRDLETYATTSDGMQLYLYVGGLKYGGQTYPLFFIPIEASRQMERGDYVITLRNHLYANKRAIDFVLQELGNRQRREWLSPIRERISYLSPEQSVVSVASPLFSRVAVALDLAGQVSLDDSGTHEASTTSVTLSTALHFAAFDRADEALLNDYEEMISQAQQNMPGVVSLFEGIVRGVITENPTSVNATVDADWGALPLVDRLVRDTPIPLNEEQVKILSALERDDCKIILVEGPPGTGKSHTIVAIAADCALKKRSCLVLSDKKEALDVVQSKLSETMSRVRHDKHFPNPILRLGQEQANFKRLTSNQTLAQVTAYAHATKANEARVTAELTDTKDRLKLQIGQTVNSLGTVALKDVARLQQLEVELDTEAPGLSMLMQEVQPESILTTANDLNAAEGDLKVYCDLLFRNRKVVGTDALRLAARQDAAAADLDGKLTFERTGIVTSIDVPQIRVLRTTLLEFEQLRSPLFGYLFGGKRVRALEARLNGALEGTRPLLLRSEQKALRAVLETAETLRQRLPEYELGDSDLPTVYAALARGRVFPVAAAFHRLVESLSALPSGMPAQLAAATTSTALSERWQLAIEYLRLFARLGTAFRSAPAIDYLGTKTHIEQVSTVVMNAEVDNRLVTFMNTHRADARILSSLITKRQKFPEEKFASVKESFPVIIASIREFGEYMPLAPDLFDVLIIDEASQVSVAQAFPALLRAKKIVVLGDSKQFSNTKSHNASIALNTKYRSDLESFFRREVSQEAAMLQRLARFDVKCSVLEFVQLCANYTVMLRKHFRSYAELISFSSKTFYAGQLQAVKIRGCPLSQVIQFDVVDASAGTVTRGTNEAEGKYILLRLLELLEEDEPPTVGVITPFREQQALLSRMLFGHTRGAEFQDRLRLKVMTCDSCQGEERQLIFYSLVATRESDALNYVFPVSLDNVEEAVEDKLKVQRLNVAFSRAQEMIWFVLSKPIDEFRGSIGKVLAHYHNVLTRSASDDVRTDPASPMEAQLLLWLKQTAFYQQNEESLSVLPQFPLGDYLKQLDPMYAHPAYRVDFLLTLETSTKVLQIVIEYDGFAYHFQKGRDIHVGNYERYMTEADIERQLTLESYGYRFLRVNRFNLGADPVRTLSERLAKLVSTAEMELGGEALGIVQTQAMGLASRELKPCQRCGRIQAQEEFYDVSLRNGEGGIGRICRGCKAVAADENAAKEVTRASATIRRFRRRRWR